MTNVSANIVANFGGRAFSLVIGFVFVPIYVRLLGIEAYGLIGFFLTLQGALGVMDLGFSLTLNRELARASAGTRSVASAARLLRTLEAVYWIISLILGAVLFMGAPVIAERWINAGALDPESVSNAIRAMGIVFALQAPSSLYQGGLTGLQKQVTVNGLLAVAAVARGLGAVIILKWISATVGAYFLWQAVVACLVTVFSMVALWRRMPGFFMIRPRIAELRGVWKYSIVVAASAGVGVALTQVDKLILSRFMSLAELGDYTLAGLAASLLWAIIYPVNSALFPRFAQAADGKNEVALQQCYHKACQLLAVLLFPVATIVVLHAEALLFLWTSNSEMAIRVGPLLALLAIGTALNGVASLASSLQSAAGWPGLILNTNIVLALIVIPTLLFVIPRWGALGAAFVWVAANACYVLVAVPIMHSRILTRDLSRWAIGDVLVPLMVTLIIVLVGGYILPTGAGFVAKIFFLGVLWLAATIGAASAAPYVRSRVLQSARDTVGKFA